MELLLLIFLFLLAVLAWFWFDSMRAREAAERLAAEWCRAHGWELLDGTVALVSFSPGRVAGTLRIRRRYEFAHTRGDFRRHSGSIVMAGSRLESFVVTADTVH